MLFLCTGTFYCHEFCITDSVSYPTISTKILENKYDVENVVEWNVDNFLHFTVDHHINMPTMSYRKASLVNIIHEGHKVCCDGRNKSCYGK